jgi:ADP-heptose:LPS heptosyltransferase
MPTLLYHTGALGDFITVLPTIAFWKKSRPGDRLVLLGKSTIGDLALDAGLIDEAWDIDTPRFVPLFRDDFSSSAAELLSVFDAAIVFADDSSPLLANLRRSGIAHLHSQKPFPEGRGAHVIDYHLSLITDLSALSEGEKLPRLAPSEHSCARSIELLPAGAAPVALHPGSGSRLKNWPSARYREIGNRLRNRGYAIAWIRGPADSAIDVPPGDLLVDAVTLPLLAAFLFRCKLFIGNDSGVAHLAAAVGCAIAIIFGSSDPIIWSPRGPVVAIVHKNVGCSPCHGQKNIKDHCEVKCLRDITVDDVASVAEGILDWRLHT